MQKQYYIISNKHRQGETVIFWSDEFSGYTKHRKVAGVYTLEQIKESHYDFPIYGENNFDFLKEQNFIIETTDFDKMFTETYTYNYFL